MGRRSDHGSLIELLDAVVGAEAAAYTTDRYGQVANPAATCQVRDLMHQLAELIFERDGCYPPWWRAVGEVA